MLKIETLFFASLCIAFGCSLLGVITILIALCIIFFKKVKK